MTVRWIFALCVQYKWSVVQLDVKCAFLHSKIDRLKYVSVPRGVDVDAKKFVCKLNKAFYGLTTAPKCWNATINDFMQSIGFLRRERERCIYSKQSEELIVIVLIYVDDLLITGSDVIGIKRTWDKLKERFDIRDLGTPTSFLGFQLQWNETDNSLFLSQCKYIQDMQTSFGVNDCKPVSTPMIPISSHKSLVTKNFNHKIYSYKQAIGALLFLSNTTRPDLSFAVNFLSRAQSDSKEIHWIFLQRLFGFLRNMFGIM